MRVNVTVTIHSIDALSVAQLGQLTMLLTLTFRTGVAINTDKRVATVSLGTNDIQSVFRTVESLTTHLAVSYHPNLWTSVSVDVEEEQS